MTKPPPPPLGPRKLSKAKHWRFTRNTQLESGEHQIDGYDIDGFPIRLCTVAPPPTPRGPAMSPVEAKMEFLRQLDRLEYDAEERLGLQRFFNALDDYINGTLTDWDPAEARAGTILGYIRELQRRPDNER